MRLSGQTLSVLLQEAPGVGAGAGGRGADHRAGVPLSVGPGFLLIGVGSPAVARRTGPVPPVSVW